MKIRTEHVFPPIPIRDYDWAAVIDDEYDGAEDAGPQLIGSGRSEQEAISDLREQIAEREAARSSERDSELFKGREEFKNMTGARVATQIMFGLRAERARMAL